MLAAATWKTHLFPRIDPSALAPDADTVEMILLPPETKAPSEADQEMPKSYTEIPDRQASETPPEKAEYLARHHSLAADNVLGGDSDQPAAQKEWISDQVQIKKEDLAGAPGVKVVEQATVSPPTPRGQETDVNGRDRETKPSGVAGDKADDKGRWALAEPREGLEKNADTAREDAAQGRPEAEKPHLAPWWQNQEPSILKPGRQGSSGDRGFDFDQAARGKVASGVAIDGDFSLNTYEWDYAPWMHRFTNELYRHWVPPYAYRLGILQGHTVIKLVIRRDGTIADMDVLETEGHESLHEASVAALKAFAPYPPLPPHFPEENLVITLGLYYPALQR